MSADEALMNALLDCLVPYEDFEKLSFVVTEGVKEYTNSSKKVQNLLIKQSKLVELEQVIQVIAPPFFKGILDMFKSVKNLKKMKFEFNMKQVFKKNIQALKELLALKMGVLENLEILIHPDYQSDLGENIKELNQFCSENKDKLKKYWIKEALGSWYLHQERGDW